MIKRFLVSVLALIFVANIFPVTVSWAGEDDEGGIGGTGVTDEISHRPEGVDRPELPDRLERIDFPERPEFDSPERPEDNGIIDLDPNDVKPETDP